VRPVELDRLPTYGVVLDTSGSMDRVLLGKALGAIAFHSLARDVPAARVVFRDAAAYDSGYVPVEEIAGTGAGARTGRDDSGDRADLGVDRLDAADGTVHSMRPMWRYRWSEPVRPSLR
jgi:hypothetical protein